MKDGIIKENGASRLVKGTLPATYEEFAALAASAGVPVDVFFNAAGWQQLPTFLNKANLLQDFTATLLGLDPADDPTVDDAFLNVFLTSANAGLLKIQVYETGTTTPISGVHITGATDLLGGELYADANGLTVGMATSETSTLQVDAAYIDLTGQTVFSGATPAQQITEITLYATRVSNPSGKIETFTASTQKMFTNKVARVDVHCVGAGAGGGRGKAYWNNSTENWASIGGTGGGAGKSSYKNSVSFKPNEKFSVTVGAGGAGAPAATGSGDNAVSAASGNSGGSSSALGISASGGSPNATNGAATYNQSDAEKAANSAGHLFGEDSLAIVPGGDGGGGGAAYSYSFIYAESNGGDPNGGNGGSVSSSGTINYGSSAKGKGGGGGGGGSFISSGSGNCRGGGDGGGGVVYIRWWY